MRRTAAFATTAALALLLASAAQPAAAVDVDFTWDDGGANDLLTTLQNWNTDVAPGSDDNLFFPTGDSATQDLAVPVIRSLSFTTTDLFTLSGAEFDLVEGIVAETPLGGVTIEPHITFLGVPSTEVSTVDGSGITFGAVTVEGMVYINGQGATNLFGDIDGTGTMTKNDNGSLSVGGDGNVDELIINDGTVHWEGVSASTDVTMNGGTLAGGSPDNIGAWQMLGGVSMNAGRISGGLTHVGSDPGSMYLSGTFTGSENAVYQVDLEGTTIDVIDVAGVFDPNDTELELYPGALPPVGTELTIARANGDITANSFFTYPGAGQLTDGEVFVADGEYFSIDYRTVTIVLTYLGDTDPAEEPVLPPTGAEVAQPVLGVLTLLVAGGLLLTIASRRRSALR